MITRDMETANASNERTPLLGNGSASNEHGQTARMATTSNEPMPLDGNVTNSIKKKLPLEENIASNSYTQPLASSPETIEHETNEVSLKEVVQAMCSAWKRHRHFNSPVERSDHPEDLDYFSTKELYAMALAWKRVTKERVCSIETSDIAEALGAAMAEVLDPVSQRRRISDEFDQIDYAILKNLLTVNLLKNWKEITRPAYGVPVRYTETIFAGSEEPRPTVSEFCLRQVELYDKIHNYIMSPEFQVVLHSLLITWPVSLLIIGSKYMECATGHHVSRLLITLGCIGCLAIVYRLAGMYLSYHPIITGNHRWYWRWKGLRLIEFTFLIVFIIQAFHFFNNHPTNEPDPTKCAENFYIFGLVINCVSIALVSAYVLIYSVIICSHYFNVWHWVFRYF